MNRARYLQCVTGLVFLMGCQPRDAGPSSVPSRLPTPSPTAPDSGTPNAATRAPNVTSGGKLAPVDPALRKQACKRMAQRLEGRHVPAPQQDVTTLAPRGRFENAQRMTLAASGSRVVSKQIGTQDFWSRDPDRPEVVLSLQPPADLIDPAQKWRPEIVGSSLVSIHEPSGTFWALDSTSGQLMWRSKFMSGLRPGTERRSLSADRDGNAFALLVNNNDRDAELLLYDWSTKAFLWRKKVPDYSRALAVGGRVYVYVPTSGKLYAYGQRGETLWIQPTAGRPNLWHASLLANHDSVVLATPKDIHIIDAVGGASCHHVRDENAEYPDHQHAWLDLSPVLSGPHLFATQLRRVDQVLNERVTFAVHLGRGVRLWEAATAKMMTRRTWGTVLADVDVVYACDGEEGITRALDANDGSIRWQWGTDRCDSVGVENESGSMTVVVPKNDEKTAVVFKRGASTAPLETATIVGLARDSRGTPYRKRMVLVNDQKTVTDAHGRFRVTVAARGGVAIRVVPVPGERSGRTWLPFRGKGQYRVEIRTERLRLVFD